MKLRALFENAEILNKATAKTIIDDCAPYLTAINRDIDNFRLYRGLQLDSFVRRADTVAQDIYKAQVRKNRVPLNTPDYLHSFIDSWMEETLGAKFRSSAIFCAAKRTTVLNFGKPYVILPIGEFKYAWSPFIEDLYSDVEEINYSATLHADRESAKEDIKKVLDSAHYQTDGITKMMREFPSHEIMIECDEYYAFEENAYDNYFFPLYNLVS